MSWLATEPAAAAPGPPAAAAPIVEVEWVVPPVLACVLLAVDVFWDAVVVWLVVPLGLMVTLLCGIARKVEFVFTAVWALGDTDWVPVELALLPALLVVLPVLPLMPVVAVVAAWVLLAVAVFWVADVVRLVVPLGLIVTVLCGIARNVELVSTEVLAFGATAWVAVELVLLVEVLLLWAKAEPPAKANATEAMRVNLLLVIWYSLFDL